VSVDPSAVMYDVIDTSVPVQSALDATVAEKVVSKYFVSETKFIRRLETFEATVSSLRGRLKEDIFVSASSYTLQDSSFDVAK